MKSLEEFRENPDRLVRYFQGCDTENKLMVKLKTDGFKINLLTAVLILMRHIEDISVLNTNTEPALTARNPNPLPKTIEVPIKEEINITEPLYQGSATIDEEPEVNIIENTAEKPTEAKPFSF